MDIDKIKAELLERRAELESRLERTHKHIYHRDEPVSPNFSEQVKQTENDQVVRALEADGIEETAMINNALQRIEDGTYQHCAGCGGDIGEKRLQAIPYTDRCISCVE